MLLPSHVGILVISVWILEISKVGAIRRHCTNYGGGLKILGDDFMINFKQIENIFTVYLAIFNSGHLLLIKATWLSSYVKN